MVPKYVVESPANFRERIVPVLDRLQKLVEGACLEPNVTQDLGVRLRDAKTASYADDQEGLGTALDMFVLTVQRHMGTDISLRRAFELVDEMVEMARVNDPANQSAFISTVADFRNLLLGLQGQRPGSGRQGGRRARGPRRR